MNPTNPILSLFSVTSVQRSYGNNAPTIHKELMAGIYREVCKENQTCRQLTYGSKQMCVKQLEGCICVIHHTLGGCNTIDLTGFRAQVTLPNPLVANSSNISTLLSVLSDPDQNRITWIISQWKTKCI